MNLGARIFGIRPFIPAVLPLMFGSTTLTSRPDLVEEWKRRFAALHVPSIGVLLGSLVRRDSVLERLPGIEVPTLVLVGAEDASLPVSLSRAIAERVPDASLVIIPDAGHLSSLEQPKRVLEAMLGFLNRLGG
jgi:pimeloyl-ACP methyl ester carboxylesterase